MTEKQIVHNHGKQFIAHNVKYQGKNALGQDVWNYTGVCTENPCNDSIRNTPYNGGRYSHQIKKLD